MKYCALQIDDYAIGIKQFITAIKTAKFNPTVQFKRTIKQWSLGTGDDILREYYQIIDENINRRCNITIRELKDFTGYIHAQHLLNGNFIIREHDLPKKLRKRFSYRIYNDRD